jgi:hypothetical protein
MNWNCFAALGAAFAVAVPACTTTKSGGVTFDSASQTTIVTGKETTVSPLAGPVRTLFLKAEISPGETGLYLVVLYLSADGWLSADQVVDTDGTTLRGYRGADETFDVQFSHVTKEIYYIPLTRRYLEAHRHSGINLRLTGAKGAVAANQPASFVQDFLTNLDATQTRLAGEVIVKKQKLIATRSEPHRTPAGQ